MPNSITVTKERCTGCTACVKVCPVTCIAMEDRPPELNVKWKKLAVIDEGKCVFCNACVEVCDKLWEKGSHKDLFKAIVMTKEVVAGKPAVDLSAYKGVWCYAEMRHGKLVPTAYELLTVARKLDATLKEGISVVLIGQGVAGQAKELIEHGADKVYVLDHPVFENFLDEVYTQAFAELILKEKPNKLLLPASTIGRSFASRLAIGVNSGLTADTTEFDVDPKTRLMHATRPAFGGNLMATILCEKNRPEMATVRPMSFPKTPKQPGRDGKIVNVPVDPSKWKQRTRFVRYEPDTETTQDISAAEIVVAGGRGLGKKDGFGVVEELAKTLNAGVAASRAAVDAGWIPYRHQVGLTGRTVRPKLYIAAGISGQIQHLAGMSSSDVIVAVNRDPECPLMKMATLSVEGDLFEILPAITQEIKKRRG
jgi:electron transfer flavoprotein alpha subunit